MFTIVMIFKAIICGKRAIAHIAYWFYFFQVYSIERRKKVESNVEIGQQVVHNIQNSENCKTVLCSHF